MNKVIITIVDPNRGNSIRQSVGNYENGDISPMNEHLTGFRQAAASGCGRSDDNPTYAGVYYHADGRIATVICVPTGE